MDSLVHWISLAVALVLALVFGDRPLVHVTAAKLELTLLIEKMAQQTPAWGYAYGFAVLFQLGGCVSDPVFRAFPYMVSLLIALLIEPLFPFGISMFIMSIIYALAHGTAIEFVEGRANGLVLSWSDALSIRLSMARMFFLLAPMVARFSLYAFFLLVAPHELRAQMVRVWLEYPISHLVAELSLIV